MIIKGRKGPREKTRRQRLLLCDRISKILTSQILSQGYQNWKRVIM
jgi:hypothetical protein